MSELPDGRETRATCCVESLLALGRRIGCADLDSAGPVEAAVGELARRGYRLQDHDRVNDVAEAGFGIRLVTFTRAT